MQRPRLIMIFAQAMDGNNVDNWLYRGRIVKRF